LSFNEQTNFCKTGRGSAATNSQSASGGMHHIRLSQGLGSFFLHDEPLPHPRHRRQPHVQDLGDLLVLPARPAALPAETSRSSSDRSSGVRVTWYFIGSRFSLFLDLVFTIIGLHGWSRCYSLHE
jgi:hypothetical protein